MIGVQKLELTRESVLEALQEYLEKHVTDGIYVNVTMWEAFTVEPYGGGTKTMDPQPTGIRIAFTQGDDKPGPSPA
jgi:hypothetical protein